MFYSACPAAIFPIVGPPHVTARTLVPNESTRLIGVQVHMRIFFPKKINRPRPFPLFSSDAPRPPSPPPAPARVCARAGVPTPLWLRNKLDEKNLSAQDEDLVDDTLDDVPLGTLDDQIEVGPIDVPPPPVDFDDNDGYDDGYDSDPGIAGVDSEGMY